MASPAPDHAFQAVQEAREEDHVTTPRVVWIVARCGENSVRDGWLHFVVDGVRRAGTSSRRGWLLGYQL